MKAVIDRFEGEYAVIRLEDGQYLNILRTQLPERSFEGLHLEISFDGEQKIHEIVADDDETAIARKRIEEKLQRLRDNKHLEE